MFLHRDLPRLTVTLQNEMPRKDCQSFEDQKILCPPPLLKHWLRSTPPTQISERSSFSPSSWPQHLNKRDYECPFQKWTAPGPLRQTCHRTLSLPCQITHLASTEVMSAFWVWLKFQHYFPGYFVSKGTNSRSIYPSSWGMKRLSSTFHQTIQIPNPEIEPSWKGGWNISVWSYLTSPNKAYVFKLLKGETLNMETFLSRSSDGRHREWYTEISLGQKVNENGKEAMSSLVSPVASSPDVPIGQRPVLCSSYLSARHSGRPESWHQLHPGSLVWSLS